jgi:hypothetical protein
MPTTITLQPTGQLLTVPTKWADVTLAQFVALMAPEPGDTRTEAEVLCGLEAGGFGQLLVDQALIIVPLLAFAADASDVLERLPTPGLRDVGSMPYGTLRVAQDYIEAHEGRPWLAYGARLLALYRMTMLWGSAGGAKVAACEAALLASPVTEVYPDMLFFHNALGELMERHRPDELDHSEYSDEEIDAGAEELAERFDGLLSLDLLANESILNYSKVLRFDAETVLLKLRLEGARSAYQRRLSEAHNSKNTIT